MSQGSDLNLFLKQTFGAVAAPKRLSGGVSNQFNILKFGPQGPGGNFAQAQFQQAAAAANVNRNNSITTNPASGTGARYLSPPSTLRLELSPPKQLRALPDTTNVLNRLHLSPGRVSNSNKALLNSYSTVTVPGAGGPGPTGKVGPTRLTIASSNSNLNSDSTTNFTTTTQTQTHTVTTGSAQNVNQFQNIAQNMKSSFKNLTGNLGVVGSLPVTSNSVPSRSPSPRKHMKAHFQSLANSKLAFFTKNFGGANVRSTESEHFVTTQSQVQPAQNQNTNNVNQYNAGANLDEGGISMQSGVSARAPPRGKAKTKGKNSRGKGHSSSLPGPGSKGNNDPGSNTVNSISNCNTISKPPAIPPRNRSKKNFSARNFNTFQKGTTVTTT